MYNNTSYILITIYVIRLHYNNILNLRIDMCDFVDILTFYGKC